MSLPPMMTQYWSIKNNYKDYLILFRVGDFFELFYDDAVIASELLGLTLTKKTYGKQDINEIPMGGIPHHIYLPYCYKLVMANYKIAVCDQMETPEEAKLAKRSVVHRTVTKILTKSTIYYEDFSWDDHNHFLISCIYDGMINQYFILIGDLGTNEFFYKYLNKKDVNNFIGKINPEEILISKYDENKDDLNELLKVYHNKITIVPTMDHLPINDIWQEYCNKLSHRQKFNVNTLLSHLLTHGIDINKIKQRPINFPFEHCLGLSSKTIKQLHLLPHHKQNIHSILQIIDFTKTPMGKRLLQQYLLFPLINIDEIYQRQNKIKFFYEFLKNNYINLTGLGDLSKHLNNCLKKTIKPLDLLKMAHGLERILEIFKILNNHHYLTPLNYQCYTAKLIINTMEDEVYVEEGRIIKSNNLPLLEEYGKNIQNLDHQLKTLIDNYHWQYKINNIKIKYDQRNGYFLEAPKSQEKIITSENIFNIFNIIQYGVNYVRFITQDFINLTQEKTTYDQLSKQIHYNIFDQLLDKVIENASEIKDIIDAIGAIDIYQGLSQLISQNHWVFPHINNDHKIIIHEGYHPLVKHFNNNFVSNDLNLDGEKNFFIITGPNMGGKSTFLRQNAIMVILGQMGCPIPAKSGTIGIVDNIFTRIGADDDLLEGASTFMVEMEEMAYILNNATEKSLVIIDELGRGTSVNDGLALAHSIINELINYQCKCLFSTHFHDLHNILKDKVKYYYCGYKFNPQLSFTYKIHEGIINESFGLHVAQLAGINSKIINDAKLFKNKYNDY